MSAVETGNDEATRQRQTKGWRGNAYEYMTSVMLGQSCVRSERALIEYWSDEGRFRK